METKIRIGHIIRIDVCEVEAFWALYDKGYTFEPWSMDEGAEEGQIPEMAS